LIASAALAVWSNFKQQKERPLLPEKNHRGIAFQKLQPRQKTRHFSQTGVQDDILPVLAKIKDLRSLAFVCDEFRDVAEQNLRPDQQGTWRGKSPESCAAGRGSGSVNEQLIDAHTARQILGEPLRPNPGDSMGVTRRVGSVIADCSRLR